MQKQGSQETDLDFFVRTCKTHSLKITPQRMAIYRELIKSKEHPSADMMHNAIQREFPNISFDTVNRTLLTFADIGLAVIVEGYGDSRRFDPDTEPHHHFHCRKCGVIVDFRSGGCDTMEIPQDIDNRFTILSKRVILDGFCDRCEPKG